MSQNTNSINIYSNDEASDNAKVIATVLEANEFFDTIMQTSNASGLPQMLENREYIQSFVRRNIDFDLLILSIPVEKLKKSYPHPDYDGHYTFLNKLVAGEMKGLTGKLSDDTLHYLAIHSEVKKNATFELYIRNALSFFPSGVEPITFSTQTIDYFLDNHNWSLGQRPAFVDVIAPVSGVYTTLSIIMQKTAYGYEALFGNKFYNAILTQEQKNKMIEKTPSEDIQIEQKGTFAPMATLIAHEDLSLAQMDSIARKFNFSESSKIKNLVGCMIVFLHNSLSGKGFDFLNSLDEIHGIDWAKALLVDNNYKEALEKNLHVISGKSLHRLIFEKDYGSDMQVRALLSNDERAAKIISEYDIIKEKEKLIERINEVGEKDLKNQASTNKI